jgi:hypothetical protein
MVYCGVAVVRAKTKPFPWVLCTHAAFCGAFTIEKKQASVICIRSHFGLQAQKTHAHARIGSS